MGFLTGYAAACQFIPMKHTNLDVNGDSVALDLTFIAYIKIPDMRCPESHFVHGLLSKYRIFDAKLELKSKG